MVTRYKFLEDNVNVLLLNGSVENTEYMCIFYYIYHNLNISILKINFYLIYFN